jgi:Glycosyl transferase family 90
MDVKFPCEDVAHVICSLAYRHIAEAGNSISFHEKDSRMFWRGVTKTSPDRNALLEVTRGHLDVADVVDMIWDSASSAAPDNFVTGSEMCAWKYIIYTEGKLSLNCPEKAGESYSGRLKYNMLCNSVMIGPQQYWIEFWSHLIVPGYNYVVVNRDWTNLLSTHQELEANADTTAQIARNALSTMDHLDVVGVNCYIHELIRQYANVCRWTVEKPELEVRKIAGKDWMTIEDYILST